MSTLFYFVPQLVHTSGAGGVTASKCDEMLVGDRTIQMSTMEDVDLISSRAPMTM
jgi:hypothetical protein